MNQNYSELIEQVSDLLFKTIVEHEPNLAAKIELYDLLLWQYERHHLSDEMVHYRELEWN